MTEPKPFDGLKYDEGMKYDEGKIQAGILMDFNQALMEVAKVGTFGAKKYKRDSWTPGEKREDE